MSTKITIIGGGNLGASIAKGLLKSAFLPAENLTVTRRNLDAIRDLAKMGINTLSDNALAIEDAEWIIFAVKPFQIQEIIKELLPKLDPNRHKLISVITGVHLTDLQEMTSSQVISQSNFTIFRAMPNTAIAIQESMTCLCSNTKNQEDIAFVNNIFTQLGESIFIEESLMDAATVLGACGTAYAMRFIRANIQGGIEIGFDAMTAALIASQTVKGAAQLLLSQKTHPEQEIDKVTTPKGCTIAGLNEMEHQGFSSSLIKGISVSYKKIKNDM